jgi:hypothetical protein
MTSIDPTGRLLAHLRQQAQEIRRQKAAAENTRNAAPSKHPQEGQDLLGLTTQQVREIDRDDPHARQKAFRVYLASTLMQEFGADLANDPAFTQLLERVQSTMEADPQLRRSIDQAGEILLRASRGGQ